MAMRQTPMIHAAPSAGKPDARSRFSRAVSWKVFLLLFTVCISRVQAEIQEVGIQILRDGTTDFAAVFRAPGYVQVWTRSENHPATHIEHLLIGPTQWQEVIKAVESDSLVASGSRFPVVDEHGNGAVLSVVRDGRRTTRTYAGSGKLLETAANRLRTATASGTWHGLSGSFTSRGFEVREICPGSPFLSLLYGKQPARLEPGDVVRAFDGTPFTTWDAVQPAHVGATYRVTVLSCRGGDDTDVYLERADAESPSPLPGDWALSNRVVAFELYHQLARTGAPESNLVASPRSLQESMTLVEMGAGGRTAEELARFVTDVRSLAVLDGANGAGIHSSNKVWVAENIELLADYVTRVKQVGATTEATPFRNPAVAMERINAWAREESRGAIAELLQSSDLSPDVRLVLTNIIDFEQAWRFPFTPEKQPRLFQLRSGQETPLEMMSVDAVLRCTIQPQFFAVAIPYKDSTYELLLIAPRGDGGFETVKSLLTIEHFPSLVRSMKSQYVRLVMPTFAVQQRLSLKETLRQLKVESAFGDGADFSRMSERQHLRLSDVVQQVDFRVDRFGTKATAATAAIVVLRGEQDAPDHQLVVDRPFVFALANRSASRIAFIGHICDPR